MRIGLAFGDVRGALPLAEIIAQIEAAATAGFPTAWSAQALGWDALTTLAIAGQRIPAQTAPQGAGRAQTHPTSSRADGRDGWPGGMELGTAVIPVAQRHPLVLASQALTTQAATGNRLTLGIGAGISAMVGRMYGLPVDRPVRRMREYLEVLRPLLRGESVEHRGENLTAMGRVGVPDARPPQVLLAALGPAMLRVAGEVADGAITWMTGPRTLADHIVPTITKAAADAGRPFPRVVAGFTICVTNDEQAARAGFDEQFALAGQVPEYRAMLDREGATSPADLLIAGDEESVIRRLNALRSTGITDLMATPVGDASSQARTTTTLAALLT